MFSKKRLLLLFTVFCSIIVKILCQSSFNVNPLYQSPVQQQHNLPQSMGSNPYSSQYGNQMYQQNIYTRFGGGPEGISQLKEFEKYRDLRTEEGITETFFMVLPMTNHKSSQDGIICIRTVLTSTTVRWE